MADVLESVAGTAAGERPAAETGSQEASSLLAPDAASSSEPIIWTPGFIVCFALTLSLGLCVACLLTRGWEEHLYRGIWPLLGQVLLLLALWIAVVLKARSAWVRQGGLFGCLWSTFVGLNLLVHLSPVSQGAAVIAYLNASGNLSLLGMYLCFATERAHAPRWDSCFFGLALPISCGATLFNYWLTPADMRSSLTLVDACAAAALVLSLSIWWLRPACWKQHPGPTLLFGLSPAITLILSIPGITTSSNNFFFVQVADLCLLLGGLRILQAQRVLS
jgi:hypothetical protein